MKKFAPFCILLAGILWGCIGLFTRTLNALGLSAMNIVALRAFMTSLFMVSYLFLFNRDRLKIRLKDLWCFLGTGLCSIVFFNFCYFKAISMTSMSVAAILLYTAPAFVMIISRFLFGEKLTGRKITALIMAFSGCMLVTGVLPELLHGNSGSGLDPAGILVGLGAGFGYALYSIFSRFAINRGYESMTITCYTFLFAIAGSMFFASPVKLAGVVFSDWRILLLVIAFAMFSTVIPYLSYTLGLSYMDNGPASIIASIEPVTASLIGVFVYQESISFSGIVGILLVLVGLAIGN